MRPRLRECREIEDATTDRAIRIPSRPRVVDGSTMSAWRAIEWAFRDQAAQLEMPSDIADEVSGGYGLEWVMIQRAKLGCQVDGSSGGHDPHEDAEAIAAVLSNLPHHLGGLRVAVSVVEAARSGMIPDAMVGAVPRIVPVEWKNENQHGRQARSVVVGTVDIEEVKKAGRYRRRVKRTVEVRACAVRLSPSPERIAYARDAYRTWWLAVRHVSRALRVSGVLRRHTVTGDLPVERPWETGR